MNAVIIRIFGWALLTFLAVFLFNNYLTFWLDWLGSFGTKDGPFDARSFVQLSQQVWVDG